MNLSYKNLKLITCGSFAVVLVAGFTSCGKKDANSPGFEFMPDMYRSPSLEYYGTHIINGDTLNASKLPVSGTISRGYIPYVYPNTPEGYEQAGLYLKNPNVYSEALDMVNFVYTVMVLLAQVMVKLALNYQGRHQHTMAP